MPVTQPPAGTIGVRDLLLKLGADNSRIGWDQKTGTVLYDNKPLLKPTSVVGGTSYARPEDIVKAASGVGLGNNLVQTRSYLEGKGLYDVGWNPITGRVTYGGQDVLKPLFVSGGRSYNLASDIESAIGQRNITPPAQQRNDLLQQLTERINKPFTYDPSQDPAYQAAAQGVRQNVMETMNERGILNSTITRDDMTKLMAQAVPAFAQQAYGREQDVIRNLMNIQGIYGDIEQQNYARKLQADANRIAEEQRAIDNAWARVQTLGYVDNEASKVLGIPVGTPTFQAREAVEQRRQQLKLAQQDNDLAWANLRLRQQELLQNQQLENVRNLFTVWEATGKAPAGLEMYGIAPGTSLYEKKQQGVDPAMELALKLASQDPTFAYMDPAEKQSLIDFYYSQLSGSALTDEDILNMTKSKK